MSDEHTDTIVASATPQGIGSIGIVRISGPLAVAVADGLFEPVRGVPIGRAQPGLMQYGRVSIDGAELDHGYCVRFDAPASFSGEQVVEIHSHGNPLVIEEIIGACVRHGCRRARPGEFTLRAFLNGRIDLVQAEALGELIAAETVEAARMAQRQLGGSLSTRYRELRDQVLEVLALLELELDFTEEGYVFVGWERIDVLIAEIGALCRTLLRAHASGGTMRRGPRVLLAGRPNAGKSSVFNALLGYSRALVSAQAGTTRDYIEERVPWRGVVFHVIDSAGLRESEEELESAGVARALSLIGEVDLVLYLVDASDAFALAQSEEEVRELEARWPGVQIVKVLSKSDLVPSAEGLDGGIRCSARVSASIEALLDHLSERLASYHRDVSALVSLRQADELREMLAIVEAIDEGSTRQTEIVAGELRRVLDLFARLTGEVAGDDVLSTVFGRFCIGK